MIRNKTMICDEIIPDTRDNMFTKILISSKYKSLLNFDTWGNEVLPELNISCYYHRNAVRNSRSYGVKTYKP